MKGLGRLYGPIETIADPGFGSDVLRVIRIRFDLLPKGLDESPKVVDLVAIVRTPYRLQQLPMRHSFVCMLRQIPKKVQFLGSQVAGCPYSGHGSRAKVDRQIADANATRRRLRQAVRSGVRPGCGQGAPAC